MKKLICMLMAAVTALSLAACGAEGDTETKKKREPQVEQIPTERVREITRRRLEDIVNGKRDFRF